jgi:hypothetical protein
VRQAEDHLISVALPMGRAAREGAVQAAGRLQDAGLVRYPGCAVSPPPGTHVRQRTDGMAASPYASINHSRRDVVQRSASGMDLAPRFPGADASASPAAWKVLMLSTQRATVGNHLLDALPGNDRRQMLAGCAKVELAPADVLYRPMERLGHVYFPISSFIALIMPVDGSGALEV